MARETQRNAKRANRPNPREDRNNIINFNKTKQKQKNIKLLPRNVTQEKYIDAMNNDNNSIIIAYGCAGVGKSLLATQYAIKGLVEGKFDKIIVTRPNISLDDKDIGHLPGDVLSKMLPWMKPLTDCMKEYYSLDEIKKMIENEIIEMVPLAYIRGRAEPVSSLIPTPKGYIKMGDLTVGDNIFGSDGNTNKVTGIFPQGTKDIFEIEFSDGSKARCTEDHLWKTRTQYEKKNNIGFTIKTTKQIKKKLKTKRGRYNHEIPIITNPVEFENQEILVDPYLMGILIGNKHIKEDILNSNKVPSCITEKIFENYDHTTLKENIELYGLDADGSFVPEKYMFNATNIRLKLLQGLMDTNGNIFIERNVSRLQYSSFSEILINNIKWIVESLGGTGKIQEYNGIYTLEFSLPRHISPFLYSEKGMHYNPRKCRRFVKDIKHVGEEDCQCISVSNEDKLYLTNNFIVTHNTFKSACIILDEAQGTTETSFKAVLTRIGEGSKIIVTGDPKQSDRASCNGLEGFLAMLKNKPIKGVEVIEFSKNDIERHPVISSILELYGE